MHFQAGSDVQIFYMYICQAMYVNMYVKSLAVAWFGKCWT